MAALLSFLANRIVLIVGGTGVLAGFLFGGGFNGVADIVKWGVLGFFGYLGAKFFGLIKR